MLTELAQFNNVQQNALMDITGTHLIKNLNTGAKSQTNFHDHAGGQFVTVMNTNNLGKMNIAGLHNYDNFTNNGQVAVNPRTFNAKGQRVGLMELEEEQPEELEDLAAFNQYANQKGGYTQIQGTHAFKNMNNAVGGNVVVLDHKGGQFATFGNTNNAGRMSVSGNHQFDNTTNSGQMMVNPAGQYAPPRLMDLAQFNQYANQKGGYTQIQGTHAFKNMSNALGGNVVVLDHKGGQFSTFGNTQNAGKMSVSGLHQFDNTTNSGQMLVNPRGQYAPPKAMLMDLATFGNFTNAPGGNLTMTGTHSIKKLENQKSKDGKKVGNVTFNDHKDGQAITVAQMINAGNATFQGKHAIKDITNSGNVQAIPRKFKDQKKKLLALLV